MNGIWQKISAEPAVVTGVVVASVNVVAAFRVWAPTPESARPSSTSTGRRFGLAGLGRVSRGGPPASRAEP